MLGNLLILFYSLPSLMFNYVFKDSLFIVYVTAENLYLLMSLLRGWSFFRFLSLMDIWVVDYPGSVSSFQVNYLLLSITHNLRIIVRTHAISASYVFSVSNIFFSAMWLEREIFDMFGVFSLGNVDLRRILTDYGFSGYPLRKDFPLSGYVEVRYDEVLKSVVLEPLELSQDFRHFQFSSPWEAVI